MPHSVDIHVGQRLRLRRSMLGLSQEQLGSAAGITFQQVQKYERGINRMGASRLYEFSKMLSTPVTYFFEGYNDGSRSAVAEGSAQGYEAEGFASKDTMALVRAYNVIKSQKIRRQILQMTKSFAGKDFLD